MSAWEKFKDGLKRFVGLFGIGEYGRLVTNVEGKLSFGQKLWNFFSFGSKYQTMQAVEAEEDEADLPEIPEDEEYELRGEAAEADRRPTVDEKLDMLAQDPELAPGAEAIREYLDLAGERTMMKNFVMVGQEDLLRDVLKDIGGEVPEKRGIRVGEMEMVLQKKPGYDRESDCFRARTAIREAAEKDPTLADAGKDLCSFLRRPEAKELVDMINGGNNGKKSEQTVQNIEKLLKTVAETPKAERGEMLTGIVADVRGFLDGKEIKLPEKNGIVPEFH